MVISRNEVEVFADTVGFGIALIAPWTITAPPDAEVPAAAGKIGIAQSAQLALTEFRLR